MKHSRIVIILALILLLGSCAGRQAARTLDRIALLADDQPDSALALLDSLAPHLGNSTALRARHTALSAHASYKAYLPLPPRDSLEAAAGTINASSVPTRERMMLNLYLGMTRQADSLYAPAIVALFDAATYADKISDNLSLGIIYRTVAEIYSNVHIGREAVHYSRLSLDAFNQVDDPKYRYFGLLDLAITLNNVKEYDECLNLCDSIFNCVDINEYPAIIDEANYVKIFALVGTNNDSAAIETYKQLAQDNTDFENLPKIMALAYSRCGRAESFANFATMSDILSDSTLNSSLYPYFAAIGDFKIAYNGIVSDLYAQNAEYDNIIKQNLTSSIREYLDHKRNEEHRQAMIYRFLWISISVIALLTIALLIFIHRSRIYRKEKQAAEALAMAQELTLRLNEANRACRDTSERLDSTSQLLSETSQLLTEKSSALRDTAGSLQAIFQSRLDSLEALCDTLYEFSGTDRQQRDLHGKAMALILEFGQNPDSIHAIRAILNQTHDRVMEKFTADFPQIKDELTMIFTYMVLGLSSRAISVLMKTDINRVYKRKTALKKLILASDSPRRDLYLNFMAKNA